MAERQEITFLLASLGYSLVLANLSVGADDGDRVRFRATDAYERTLHFMDRVALNAGDRAKLEPLQRKIEARLLLAHRISEPK